MLLLDDLTSINLFHLGWVHKSVNRNDENNNFEAEICERNLTTIELHHVSSAVQGEKRKQNFFKLFIKEMNEDKIARAFKWANNLIR